MKFWEEMGKLWVMERKKKKKRFCFDEENVDNWAK